MPASPKYRPLYLQMYDAITLKIAAGDWRPGEALPSEQALARNFDVSQGTARKVLDILTAEGLLERRQGKGTFIATSTQERELFRFFRVVRPDGSRVSPDLSEESVKPRASRAADQSRLNLAPGDRVIEINRVRLLDECSALSEQIVVPAALFPGMEKRRSLPNSLYTMYHADYGINIMRADELVRADLATAEDQRLLGATLNQPILRIERTAVSLHELKVEWRISRIWTTDLSYSVSLR